MEFTTVLTNGEVFVKHHRFSTEKLRIIMLDGDCIAWALPEAPDKKKGSLNIKDIVRVQSGVCKSSGPKDPCRVENTFSIVTKDRTLELEAKSMHVKLVWMNALFSLLKSKGIKYE